MEKYHANRINGNAPNYCPLSLVFVGFLGLIHIYNNQKILLVVACTLY